MFFLCRQEQGWAAAIKRRPIAVEDLPCHVDSEETQKFFGRSEVHIKRVGVTPGGNGKLFVRV
jgi:hypothetical protein